VDLLPAVAVVLLVVISIVLSAGLG